jgi:hypothetical protein
MGVDRHGLLRRRGGSGPDCGMHRLLPREAPGSQTPRGMGGRGCSKGGGIGVEVETEESDDDAEQKREHGWIDGCF